MRHRQLFIVALLIAFLADRAVACTCVVDPFGTGDYPTIQAAIDDAEDGDVICLTEGTFTGDGNRDIEYLGKAITVRSQGRDPESCIIDCEGSEADPHRGFYLHDGENWQSVLDGVTITNGYAAEGAALELYYASATVSNCVFINSDGLHGGHAVFAMGSSVVFTNCTFSDNSLYGVVYIDGLTGTYPCFIDCVFRNNGEFGILALHGTAEGSGSRRRFCGKGRSGRHLWSDGAERFLVSGCTFSGNCAAGSGAAIVSNVPAELEVIGCTFSDNAAAGLSLSGPAVLENTVIAFSRGGEGVRCSQNGSATVSCCNIYGNAGGDWVGCIADQYGMNGNFSADPLFCGPADGSTPMMHTDASVYSLHLNSPCLPGNHPIGYDCGLVGAHGQGCGYEIEPVATETRAKGAAVGVKTVTWGRIKTEYRE